MKLLYIDFQSLLAKDLIDAFTRMGYESDTLQVKNSFLDGVDVETLEKVEHALKKKSYDFVFSFNYFVAVSEACKKQDILYVCWVYDNPVLSLYCNNVLNSCNRIFTFDSYMVEDLRKRGVSNIYYMPLAVNSQRLKNLKISQIEKKRYEADISYVGNLYQEECEIYEAIKKYATPDLIGYIDGVLAVQRVTYHKNIIEECITEERLKQMQDIIHCTLAEHSVASLRYIYNNFYFCKRIAYLDRTEMLGRLSQKYSVELYTSNPKARIGSCRNHGPIPYIDGMSKVFACSKINLNTTIRSIRNGIPLRVLDIMGAGGFLFTNEQQDLFEYFEEDKDLVIYRSMEELEDKVAYYLKHEKERIQICESGCEKTRREFDYVKILTKLLQMAGVEKR